MSARRKGARNKEPEPKPGSVFAAIVERAMANRRGLAASVSEEDAGASAEYIRGQLAGIDGVLVLVKRAANGEPIDVSMSVKIERSASVSTGPTLEDRVRALEARASLLEARTPRALPEILTPSPSRIARAVAQGVARAAPQAPPSSDGLGACERKILGVLAERAGQATSNKQISLLTGYTESGSFSAALGRLRSEGLVQGGGSENRITDAGLRRVGPVEPMPKGRDLIAMWIGRLDPAEGKILQVLCGASPNGLEREEILRRTGYKDSGSFTGALGRLRTLSLAEPKRGWPLRASARRKNESRHGGDDESGSPRVDRLLLGGVLQASGRLSPRRAPTDARVRALLRGSRGLEAARPERPLVAHARGVRALRVGRRRAQRSGPLLARGLLRRRHSPGRSLGSAAFAPVGRK